MKSLRLLGLFLGLAGSVAAADKFWQQLTPEERATAGLEQLTPAQQAALDELAARFAKEGARHAVENVKAETAAAVREAREQAKAEARIETRKQKAESAGLPAREDDEIIHTRIPGDFHGWKGNTTFKLENGQVWQQTEADTRYFPHLFDPEVDLIPSGWAGWKLKIVKEGLWVKVKRIR